MKTNRIVLLNYNLFMDEAFILGVLGIKETGPIINMLFCLTLGILLNECLVPVDT